MKTTDRKGEIITFYSYKGGTGRSMALANVAWVLASSGKRVLVLDWDLEAPGLHRYLHPFLPDKDLTSSEGVIDFVIDFAAAAVTPAGDAAERPAENWYLPYANVLRYASSLDWAFPDGGTLDFVPAGRQGPDYATRVNSFNWKKFYEQLGGGVFLEAAKEAMSAYDYVLIDSRTGVSDTSGICTVQMPDILVVCFTYNVQSIEGAAAVAESAQLQRKRPDGEPGIKIFPVPTRVELAEKQKLELARDAAREKFDPFLWHIPDAERGRYWGRVEVLYQPFYAYEEVLATFGDKPQQTNSLLASIEAVTYYLTGGSVTEFPPLPETVRSELLGRYSRPAKPVPPQNEWVKFAPKPRELTGSERWHVFIANRSGDRSWAIRLHDVLRDLGYKVFFDQYVLKPGDNPASRLGEALESSQAAVLICPRDPKDDAWLRAEYSAMTSRSVAGDGFHFVPVLIGGGRLPAFAATRLYLDFSDYPDGPNGGGLLRLLYALAGQPLSEEAVRFAAEQDEAAQLAAAKIETAIKTGNPGRLAQLFEEGGLPWQTSAMLGCKAAGGLIRLGHYEEALQMLKSLASRFPKSLEPKRLCALALSRRGGEADIVEAQELLGEILFGVGERDPETLALYARTWKVRYEGSGDRKYLRQARDSYAEAFEIAPDDYYSGINAAATSVLLGDLSRAEAYAESVQKIVGTEPRRGDYWLAATIAELALIRRDFEKASQLYEAAVSMAVSEIGSHASTWKQACLLMRRLDVTPFNRAMIRRAFEHLPDCDDL